MSATTSVGQNSESRRTSEPEARPITKPTEMRSTLTQKRKTFGIGTNLRIWTQSGTED
jgi:hypothetical protein